jgi:hypothetical protein
MKDLMGEGGGRENLIIWNKVWCILIFIYFKIFNLIVFSSSYTYCNTILGMTISRDWPFWYRNTIFFTQLALQELGFEGHAKNYMCESKNQIH